MQRLAVIFTLCLAVLLGLCVHTIRCQDDESSSSSSSSSPRNVTEECTKGPNCFPSGVVPDGITERSQAFYCCLKRNMSRHSTKLDDGTYNCSCVTDLSLEAKIIDWARASRGNGRMCSREADCDGTGVTSNTVNDRFKYCCFDQDNPPPQQQNSSDIRYSELTTFDGDKEEFIGCRCLQNPVPNPVPGAYIVPPSTLGLNSTGESCSYDQRCQDKPAVKCSFSGGFSDVTFCCYGSRGMVTQNDGQEGGLTRCTCTDEVYGAQCQADPVAIADTTLPCLTHCDNKTDDETCTDDDEARRCCPHNMAVVASQSDGVFTSCMCKAQAAKACGGSDDTTTTTDTTDGGDDSSMAARFGGGRSSDVVVLAVFVGSLIAAALSG